MKKILIAYFLFSSSSLFAQNDQIVSYFGVFRSTLHNSQLNGNLMKNDTLSTKRGSFGRSFFDLGIEIQPDRSFKAHAILRAETNMSEGNAGGLGIIFRQIRAEGTINKIVKYELGDIDIGLTKYTVHNNEELFGEFESSIYKTRRDILAYDNFNNGSKWRFQGFQVNTGLSIGSSIEKLGLHIFATRVKKANLTSIPDRFVLGGKVDIKQSKYLRIGINYVSMFDNKGSAPDTVVDFNNNVLTSDFEIFPISTNSWAAGISGELGICDNHFFVKNQNRTASSNDYFYDAGIFAHSKKKNLKVRISYRNVGPDYFSPTAQTLRIMANSQPSVFGKFMNDSLVRPANLFDRMTDYQLYNQRIGTTLMAYLPIYGNVQPYGQATPNREGFTIDISKTDSADIVYTSLRGDILSELLVEGTSNLRKYISLQGGARVRIGSLLSFKKDLTLSVGARYEKTKRAGIAQAELSTIMLDGGITLEVLKKIDFIIGTKYLRGSGNESYAVLNDFREINSFVDYLVNQQQLLVSPSLKFRFGKYSYTSIEYNRIFVKDLKNSIQDYTFNQLFINFSLIF